MKKKMLVILTAGLLGLGAVACNGGGTGDGAPVDGGTPPAGGEVTS